MSLFIPALKNKLEDNSNAEFDKYYQTLSLIAEKARIIMNGKYSSVFKMVNGQVERIYASSPILFKLKPRPSGNTALAYKEFKSYLLNKNQLIEIHPEFENFQAGSDISVPLYYKNEVFGVLSILSHPDNSYSTNDLNKLEAFSNIATQLLKDNKELLKLNRNLNSYNLFLSMTAHELKTPLTIVSIYSQILAQKTDSHKLENKIKPKLLSQVERLTKLTNELMQINQIKSGKLKFNINENNIKNLIEEVLTNFKNAYPNYIYIFSHKLLKEDETVLIDRDKIIQAIINLLANAVKFSPENSTIKLNLFRNKSFVLLEIVDQGVGIAKNNLAKIFTQFYKGEKNKYEGLGLGLYLVKYVMEVHKGKITVESKANKGTTITLYLPLPHDRKR